MKPATLQTIFDVFIKTRDKIGPTAQSATASSSSASTSKSKTPSPADRAQADKFKQSGNAQMTSKKYDDAIESYNEAIALDPTNAVYYSNRAAAFSSKGDHLSAVGDAEQAILVDPKFVKAYHRLGFVLCIRCVISSLIVPQTCSVFTRGFPSSSQRLRTGP